MKKLAKNIPSPFPSKGTPIFRDTTALPFAAGGPLHDRDINGNLLNSTYASPLGNMYREGGPFGEDQGTFDYASSVYASQPGNYFKDGGPVNTSGPRVDSTPALSDSAMKAKIAYEAAMGNKAAQRMLSLDPKTYDFGNGDYGTHYMSSIDNYAVPELQDKGETQLANVGAFPPPSNEDFRFQTPEEADYFATHYKEISPMTTRQYKDGGQFQGKYSLPEDSFKQGGNNLHNSVYASSPQQYPAVYNFGGTLGDNLSTRQQMYMPLDHITRTGGSILSMSNTPEMSGEGKDLVYANGGALNNSYAGGGQIYTYAGRPGAEYQKGANGWEIRTEHTNGFVPVKDPTGKRTALLNAQAKPTTTKSPYQLQQEAKAQAGQSGYDMMAGNKPQVSDNTKVQITNKPIPTVGTPIKTAEELAHDQFVAWGAEQDKKRNAQNPAIDPRTGNYRPMSAGEADWVWSAPLAGSTALQAAGAIGAMALPGLSAVPGATVGNLVNSGFIANSLYNTPENAKDWYDVSQGKKDWTDAALGTGEIALGMIGSGAGLKSIAQDINRGNKYLGKTLGTESGLLSNAYKYNPWAFKPDANAYYHRSPNLENIVNKETGMLQGYGQSEAGKAYSELATPGKGPEVVKQAGSANEYVSTINLKKPANSQLYFAKGTPLDWGRTNMILDKKTGKLIPGQGYAGPYMAEVKDVPMGSSTKGRLPGAEPTGVGSYAVSKRPISLDETKFYKEHWLQGYKEVPKKVPGASKKMDIKLLPDDIRSKELDMETFGVYKGDKKVGEISGNKLSNGDFETMDIGIDPKFQKQGIATEVYKQLNQTLPEGNKVRSWGAFVENNGVAPGRNTWQSLERQGLAKQNEKGVYEMLPKKTTNSKEAFKSEIDWNNWNKEIPENKALMQEYNTIEQTAKANGTWMKNPDGSVFQGTPEQFVQQNSENFKKAFGNSKLVNPDGSPWILEHGSPKKFDTFDESKFQLGDAGYSGSGIYTVPPKGSADSYTISGRRFHTGDIEPTTYKLYGQGNNPITSEELIKLGKNSPAGKEMDLFNFHRKSAPLNEQLLDYDVAIHNQNKGIARVRDLDDAWEVVFPTNKQLKSATGNNGMFDMSNPNIYKSLLPYAVPTAVGGTALANPWQQQPKGL